ncbi:MAG TPA: hypothetical protein VFP33_01860 [Gallionella sp.]|nr:hypothetical protein [Gallionella sp.]
MFGKKGQPIRQRNYYEHIIRNEPSLQEIREYIANNSAQWANDRENPDAPVGARFIAPNDNGTMKPGAINRTPTEKENKK